MMISDSGLLFWGHPVYENQKTKTEAVDKLANHLSQS